ncbi:conserved exported hypothetical protein [Vibrio chagasii]|uniref:LPP20 family lipoprotein n=1 Tax=Vibrio TaxID=662 RepID=UPI0014933546|nr:MULTISPECIES: LPP20 family lipoprotein [Vibrio]MCG9565458.1 LPP20 family lipoprotein [Vibrio chagasii]NOI41115.1 hypothetical protein [Vibrio sp. 070316B]CAH6803460.1 conserved exported hypothetical protein [Vibrio chagasii]CAH6812607.1 conserved exported hypothetical protein [Vibrio chagasii]CAH6831741.1 conserved exported hypothetical protein [Vibrio chagasii]
MKYISLILFLVTHFAWAEPEWATNIVIDPDSYIAIGIGDSLSNAKLDAKNQIASSIHSTHTFTISQSVGSRGLKGFSETSSYSETNAEKVLLPELTWPHMEGKNGLYYVMGKAKKSDLVDLYERTLSITVTKYSNQLISNTLSLKDYLLLLSDKEEVMLAAERASIIYKDSLKGKKLYSQFVSLIDKTNKYVNEACLKIIYKGHSSFERKMFEPMVEQALASSGLSVGTLGECDTLKFNIVSEGSKANGQRTDKIKLFIELGEPAVTSKAVSFFGYSSGSKKKSFSNAVDNFNQHFNSDNYFMLYLLDSSKSTLYIQ